MGNWRWAMVRLVWINLSKYQGARGKPYRSVFDLSFHERTGIRESGKLSSAQFGLVWRQKIAAWAFLFQECCKKIQCWVSCTKNEFWESNAWIYWKIHSYCEESKKGPWFGWSNGQIYFLLPFYTSHVLRRQLTINTSEKSWMTQ